MSKRQRTFGLPKLPGTLALELQAEAHIIMQLIRKYCPDSDMLSDVKPELLSKQTEGLIQSLTLATASVIQQIEIWAGYYKEKEAHPKRFAEQTKTVEFVTVVRPSEQPKVIKEVTVVRPSEQPKVIKEVVIQMPGDPEPEPPHRYRFKPRYSRA
jgi:hypothetical protein